MDVQNYFQHELEDQGMFVIMCIPGDAKNCNIFMKNVTAALFNHLIPLYVRHEYIQEQEQ